MNAALKLQTESHIVSVLGNRCHSTKLVSKLVDGG